MSYRKSITTIPKTACILLSVTTYSASVAASQIWIILQKVQSKITKKWRHLILSKARMSGIWTRKSERLLHHRKPPFRSTHRKKYLKHSKLSQWIVLRVAIRQWSSRKVWRHNKILLLNRLEPSLFWKDLCLKVFYTWMNVIKKVRVWTVA